MPLITRFPTSLLNSIKLGQIRCMCIIHKNSVVPQKMKKMSLALSSCSRAGAMRMSMMRPSILCGAIARYSHRSVGFGRNSVATYSLSSLATHADGPTPGYRRQVSTDDAKSADRYLAEWPCNFRLMINAVTRSFSQEHRVEVAKNKCIDKPHWLDYTNTFRRTVIKDPLTVFNGDKKKFLKLCNLLQQDIDADKLVEMKYSKQLEEYLFKYCVISAEVALKDSIESFKVIKSCSDLSLPKDWYPFARIIKRKIVFHGGPTNSGKVGCSHFLT
jgi:hypothetical protein